MRYVLGIHLGATRTTAAVSRSAGGPWGTPEAVPLLGGLPWLDSALYIGRDGTLEAGQAALRHAPTEPERIARAPHLRTGDPVPVVLGEASYPAESLAAALIGWVADRVAEAEGADAERIVVTHPPSWSAYRRGLLHDALDQAQLPGVLALPSPIAAAESHHAREPVDEGAALAVCHLGGEHVETAVLRRGPRGFELLAHAEAAEQDAGARLDDLLVRHVLPRAGVDENDPGSMARLRMACTAAKERLCQVPEAAVLGEVGLSRTEFESLARPVLAAAVAHLERIAATAPADGLTAAVLVGGTARIPLAAELARTMLSCPVVVDDDPGTALARGAALAAQPRPAPPPVQGELSGSLVPGGGPELPAVYGQPDDDLEPPPERPPVEVTPLEPPKRRFSLSRKGTSAPDRDEDR
ncbi:Hsp70 family protein [Prauserella muralis]|uniref:Molecular chaperone n=1 Tax=Prauserella muralis TaxID=588067 RepID=A0A2V4B8B1_9PSEU|nr:Hsp70 family protein [Prauserella muralis]PXY31291.1 molecular chaperone [Prauserella muralis]TWE14398.1 Hsp70 protein [Prauserella muralis]